MATYYWVTRNRGNKYGNKKVELDGIKFDSKKEMRRYAELKVLEKAGEIRDLQLQVGFILQEGFTDQTGKRQQAIKYIADFTYYQQEDDGCWYLVIEDVKSPATRKNAVYRLKNKMMAYRGYYITEV